MPYVGNIPAEKYAAFNVQYFTTSATDTYTLDRAVANELDIRLVINNVIQEPGSGKAYTAAGTTLTLSAATAGTDTMYAVYIGKAVQTVNPGAGSVGTTALATNAVTQVKMADDSVGTAEIADNAVTLAKMASGTDGNIISYDASGNPVAVATGSTGQVLTSAGAGAPPTFATASGTTINNNADNRVITGSGTANTLEGEQKLTFDGTQLSNTAEIAGFNTILDNDNGDAQGLQIKIKANDDANNKAFDITTWDTGSTYTSKFHIRRSGDVIFSHRMMGETSIESDIFQARNTTNGNRNYRGLSDAGGQTFYVTEDGAGYFAGGTSSDATLKNVVEDTPHGLDKIKNVQPKTYYWKKRGVDTDGNEIETDDNLDERKHYGVLAQDLQSVLPEITYGTEGKMSVDYNGLLMVAINSIKELKTKIETLETKVTTLESA